MNVFMNDTNQQIFDTGNNPRHDPGDMYVSVELVARVIGESVEQLLAKDLEYRIRCLGARNFDGVEIYNSRILGKHFCLDAAESSHGYLL